jgi:hypothetical protein
MITEPQESRHLFILFNESIHILQDSCLYTCSFMYKLEPIMMTYNIFMCKLTFKVKN